MNEIDNINESTEVMEAIDIEAEIIEEEIAESESTEVMEAIGSPCDNCKFKRGSKTCLSCVENKIEVK